MTNLNCNSKNFEKHRNSGTAISHKKPAPEYPAAAYGHVTETFPSVDSKRFGCIDFLIV